VDYFVADLSSQEDIRQLAQAYRSRYPFLHVLVNNAGIVLFRRHLSVDGIELTFATNHLAPFLLTNLLLDVLKASAPARIVNVSSIAHKWTKFNPENGKTLSGLRAYFASKFANILFTYELARRLEGTSVTVNALHPGFVATNIGRSNGLLGQIVLPVSNWFSKAVGPEEGAETSIYLATSPEGGVVSGEYFVRKKAVPSSKRTYDEAIAKRLWDISVEMTGLYTKNVEWA
jgi:NAD(P)-dependent dehydrogenase (short-subunit alcohol dehydrogenase family)